MPMRTSCKWLAPICILTWAGHAAPGRGQDDDGTPGYASDVAMASLAGTIDNARAKQFALAQQASGIAEQRTRARKELGLQVRALYRITHPGLSPAMGGMSAVLRHVGRVKRLRHIVEREAQGLQTLEADAAAVRTRASEVTQELEQAQVRLAALKAAPRETLTQGDSERAGSHYGLRIVDGSPIANFENERGRLGSPVAGDVRIVPSRVAESDGPGVAFQTPVGTVVHAVAPGRVAFADRYGGYGQLVILDHGRGYYTAYGGLGTIDVRVGDDVMRQARLGDVGNELSPPALFFEVRKGSRSLDPGTWLGY